MSEKQSPIPSAKADGDADLHARDDAAPAEGGTSMLVSGADLANLLANGQWDSGEDHHAMGMDVNAYDGHVALALDPGALPDIDSALDLLTSSHDLFDVPALDVSGIADDASPA